MPENREDSLLFNVINESQFETWSTYNKKYKEIPVQRQIYRIMQTNGHIDAKVNFTFLLTSSGQEWQFNIGIDIQCSTMAILHS